MCEIKIQKGDCLKLLPKCSANKIGSVVTDPPYNLGFMGKKWDKKGTPKEYQDWCERWGNELLRVMKPGAWLCSFGGTKTYHRLTSGLENAGFAIKDCIMWLYGQGFPKNYDISKGFDKQTGPTTDLVKKWDGWGTALKPSHEPIVLAQKPREGTYCNNVEKWGCGGINIDGCRVPTEEELRRSSTGFYANSEIYSNDNKFKFNALKEQERPEGRWPANIILDEEAGEMLDEQSGESVSSGGTDKAGKFKGKYGKFSGDNAGDSAGGYGDKGGASRFFYTAKASKKERTVDGKVENNHPTVKPIDLIKYLVKLVNPPGETVLDPFCGSGTTLLASYELGADCVGIDNDEEAVKITKKRLEAWKEMKVKEEKQND